MVRCRGLSRMVLLAFTWHCLLLASSFSFFLYLISKTFFGDGLFTYLSLLQAAQTLGCYLIISSIKHWRKQWPPTAALLPGKSHGRRSLEGCSPWGHKESRHDIASERRGSGSQGPWPGEAAPQPEGNSVCAQQAPARLGFPGALPPRTNRFKSLNNNKR